MACIQVNENGVISFDKPWMYSYPHQFPTHYFYTREAKAIAPFWSDNDIRREGNVRYASYCVETATRCSRTFPLGKQIMNLTNLFIQSNQGANEEQFVGTWLLIAQWDHVPPSTHGDSADPLSPDTQVLS